MERYTVTFYPDKKKVAVEKGQTLLATAISCGIYINSSCGGEGVCGRCKVIVKKGSVYSLPTGRISSQERGKGYCLACLSRVQSDLVVEIPPESRVDLDEATPEEAYESRLRGIYTTAEEVDKAESVLKGEIFVHSPLASKLYLTLPKPSLKDAVSDLERLYREIRRREDIAIMQTGIANIRHLGQLLRSSDWHVTVTLGKRNGTTEIVLIEPGNTEDRNFGFVFDIGTTTISGQLVNLNTKQILGTKATFNKQASFGTDIITRIIFAQKQEGLERLHHLVIDGMNAMIQELVKEHNVNLNDVTCCMCAGNTTMLHLLLRVDPTFIRKEPYIPTVNFVPVIRAAESGIKINPRGLLDCVPCVSSYVGGDITAGVLASGLADSKELCLFIDVGTNGEIALGNREWIASCSASAGPAFEGSGVFCGMRATKGAIQKVRINQKNLDVKYETIGKDTARGICGSGYIDLLSELLTKKVMDKNGKINSAFKNKRIRKGQYGMEFVLVFKEEADLKSDILINETDIENLKRSKGSIFAAASTLVEHMGLSFKDIQKVFIAGGFGTYLDVKKAVSIGLLPDLSVDRFIFLGNSSLTGAREVLLSMNALHKAYEIAGKMTYVELSVEHKYMDEYMAALFFPHTDAKRFPSVKL